MADRIKGITVVIGGDTTGLSKALSGVNKEISNTQKELKDVERLLKLDPTNTKLLEQRQRLLGDAVSETKNKLDKLKEAEKQVQEQFKKGDVSQRQYDALQREIAKTANELNNLQKKAKTSNTALSKFNATANKITSGASKISKAMAPVTGAIGAIGGAALATIPATEDLRTDLSKLEANAKENAVSADIAREAWRKFAVQSGETDSAVEGVSNLLQAGFTESNLQKAVEGLAGAAQRFPDTLKIESLADSLQETLTTGEATGQFGELLDRLGIGAENFSLKLSQCTTEAEKQNLVLQTLASAGLNDTYNAWVQNNEEMVKNKEANLELQEAMAELAEVVLPIVTMVTEKISDLINWFTSLDSETQKTIGTVALLVAAISPIAGMISNIGESIIFLTAHPMVALIAAIAAIIVAIAVFGDEIQENLKKVDDFLNDIFLKDWTEVFGPGIGDILNMFMANFKNIWDTAQQFLNGIIDFIRGVFTGDWERAWEGVKNIVGAIFNQMLNIVKIPINGIIQFINAMIGAINQAINGINTLSFDVPDWVPFIGGERWGFNLPTIPTIPYLAKGGVLSSGSAIVGEAGPELLTILNSGEAQVTPLTGSSSTYNSNFGGITINLYGDFSNRNTATDYGKEIGEQAYRIMRSKGVLI